MSLRSEVSRFLDDVLSTLINSSYVTAKLHGDMATSRQWDFVLYCNCSRELSFKNKLIHVNQTQRQFLNNIVYLSLYCMYIHWISVNVYSWILKLMSWSRSRQIVTEYRVILSYPDICLSAWTSAVIRLHLTWQKTKKSIRMYQFM